jgi:hypothetical protein
LLEGGRRGTPIPTTSVGSNDFTMLPTPAKALIHTHDDVRDLAVTVQGVRVASGGGGSG